MRPARVARSLQRLYPAVHLFSLRLPCCALFFFALTLLCDYPALRLLCDYPALHLPCCYIIFLYAYPAVPVFFFALPAVLTLLCLYFFLRATRSSRDETISVPPSRQGGMPIIHSSFQRVAAKTFTCKPSTPPTRIIIQFRKESTQWPIPIPTFARSTPF